MLKKHDRKGKRQGRLEEDIRYFSEELMREDEMGLELC